MTKRISTLGMIVLYIITLTLQSCQSTAGSPMTPSPEPPTTLTAQALQTSRYTPPPSRAPVTDTPTSTITPIPTQTNTPTRRPTLTMTFTPHPVVVLSNADKIRIMDLLSETEDCRLPCWNGITPGVSPLAEMQGFFARLGYDIGPWPPQEDGNEGHKEVKVEGFPPGSLSYSYFYLSLKWKNRVIDRIEIDLWGHPEQFSMNRIVKQLGNPTSIRIIHGAGGKIPVYAIGLLYNEINLVLEIRGNLLARNNFDSPDQVCLTNQKEQYIKAIMYSDSKNFEIEKEYYTDPWEDWAKVIGMDTEDLIQSLLEPNECIFYP